MNTRITWVALTLWSAALIGCGEEKKPEGLEIVDGRYQGGWRLAESGGDSPAPIDCKIDNRINSRMESININKTGYRHLLIYYISATNCQGDNRIEIPIDITFEQVAKNGETQTFKITTRSYRVDVIGDRAATYLNHERVCGLTNWQEATYTPDLDNLKACTAANAGSVVAPVPSAEDLAKLRVRLSPEGHGIAIGYKKDGETDVAYRNNTSYFGR